MSDRFQTQFHVLLVEPENNLNIGAVARAMVNLGFPYLHLVAPEEYDRARASVTACHAESFLDTVQIHTTLEEALMTIEAEAVIGFSGRPGNNPALYATLPQWSQQLPGRVSARTALLFGSEGNGLKQEHLNCCQRILRIPGSAEMSSFNLAQSVLVVLYEITRTLSEPEIVPALPVDSLPTANDREQLERLADNIMTLSGFWREGTPAPVPGTVRNLLRRLEMDKREMGILLGLFGRIRISLQRNRSEK